MRERLLDDRARSAASVNIYLNGDDVRFLEAINPRSNGDEISRSSRRSQAASSNPEDFLCRNRMRRTVARATSNTRRCPSAAQAPSLIWSGTPAARDQAAYPRIAAPRVRIFAKLEGFNPGGSVKDRPARKMLQVGLESGELCEGKVIIDSTSGNTGIARDGRSGARIPVVW